MRAHRDELRLADPGGVAALVPVDRPAMILPIDLCPGERLSGNVSVDWLRLTPYSRSPIRTFFPQKNGKFIRISKFEWNITRYKARVAFRIASELADRSGAGGGVTQGDQHPLEAGIPGVPQERLGLLIRHHPLPTVGVEERELIERILRRDDLVLDPSIPAAFHGAHGMVDRLGLVRAEAKGSSERRVRPPCALAGGGRVGRRGDADPGAVGDPIAELLGFVAGDVPSRAVPVRPGELGQPSLMVASGGLGPLDLDRGEEHGDRFDDGQTGWGSGDRRCRRPHPAIGAGRPEPPGARRLRGRGDGACRRDW